MTKNIPRYIKIKDAIVNSIQKGDLLHNGRLPSEEELANIYNVSRTTVRSALQALEAEGLVTKKHGSGNFVHLEGNFTAKNATFALLHTEENAAPIMTECVAHQIFLEENVAKKLNEKPGILALKIIKRFQDHGVEESCTIEQIPLRYIKIMPQAQEIPESLYDFTTRFCGLEIKNIVTEISAVHEPEEIFENPDFPILRMEEIFKDTNGRNIVYSNYYTNSSKVRIQVIRNRPPQFWKIR